MCSACWSLYLNQYEELPVNKVLGVIVLVGLLSGCGKTKTIQGVTYGTYGLLNQNEMKNDQIRYEVIAGNVFWAAFFAETLVAPIYFVGYSLFQPVGEASPSRIKGEVN